MGKTTQQTPKRQGHAIGGPLVPMPTKNRFNAFKRLFGTPYVPALNAFKRVLEDRDRDASWEIKAMLRGMAEAYSRILDRYIANNPIVLDVGTRNVYDEKGEIDFSRWRLEIPNLRENDGWLRYVFTRDPRRSVMEQERGIPKTWIRTPVVVASSSIEKMLAEARIPNAASLSRAIGAVHLYLSQMDGVSVYYNGIVGDYRIRIKGPLSTSDAVRAFEYISGASRGRIVFNRGQEETVSDKYLGDFEIRDLSGIEISVRRR